jgi:glycosyltransferase involved in cell wall biosynthesis
VHLLAQTRLKNWKRVIIGPTAIEQGGGGESYVARLSNVELRGPIFDSSALRREMERARILVYPSLAEGGETFGLAALEAMSAGCAVVVSDLACFRDFISDGETGFIFDHRVANALQAKLEQIGEDEELLTRVATAGWRKSREYSIDKVASQFVNDFEEVRSHA